MSELGYEMTANCCYGLTDLPDLPFDVAAAMGCGPACCPKTGPCGMRSFQRPFGAGDSR